jgi:GRF zinc finger
VVRDGANQGRKFWTCTKGSDSGCGFFEWDDEPPRNGPPRSAIGTSVGSPATSGACFKVHCGIDLFVLLVDHYTYSVVKKDTGLMVRFL